MTQASRLTGATMAFTPGLLTATGGETVHDTTQVINYAIGGKAYRKTAITDGTTPTTDGDSNALESLEASQGCAVVWCLDASGNVGVFQGEIEELDDSGNFKIAPSFPNVDLESWCPFAYQILKAGSTAGTITFGSSNWNATGFTNSIADVSVLPNRPQES